MAADDQKQTQCLTVDSAGWWNLPRAYFEHSQAGRDKSEFDFQTWLVCSIYCTFSEITEHKWKSIGFIFLTPVYAKVHVWGVTMATVGSGSRLGLRCSEGPRFGTLDGGRFCHQSWWCQMMSAGPKRSTAAHLKHKTLALYWTLSKSAAPQKLWLWEGKCFILLQHLLHVCLASVQ